MEYIARQRIGGTFSRFLYKRTRPVFGAEQLLVFAYIDEFIH
jgi:hypothetical protein